MKDEIKKARIKKTYLESTGTRMVVNACAMTGLYVIGGIAYAAGKKVLSTVALLGIGGFVICQIMDGIIVMTQNKK